MLTSADRRVEHLSMPGVAEDSTGGAHRAHALTITSNTLLALGVLLSPATQLRPDNSPVGPGEICLVVWIGLEISRQVARLGPPMTGALSRLLIFWIFFALAQSLGALVGLAIEPIRDPASAQHDSIAYLLLAIVSCLSVALPNAGHRLRQVTWILVVLGTFVLATQLVEAGGLVNISGTDPYEWNRLRGWSDNSNGLALVCAALVVLPFYLAESAGRAREALFAPLFSVLPITVGILTRSDAFLIFLLTAGPLFFGLKFRAWLMSDRQELTFRAAFAGITLLVLPIVVVGVAPWVPSAAAMIEQTATEMYEDNGQGDDRFKLWGEAARRGIESGMVGFGPGAHITESKFKRQPPPNYEAHNTPLDLFTQGGLFAVGLFVWLAATAFTATCRAGLAGLAALFSGLVIFSMFHLVVRHPLFWFGIVLCLVARDATDLVTSGRTSNDKRTGFAR